MDKQREADVGALIRLLTYATQEAERLGFDEAARQIDSARKDIPDLNTPVLADDA